MTIYTESIPNSGESLGSTRVRIHDNFSQIFTVFNQNHVDFNTIPGEGKHKFLQMPEQASAPSTATNEGGLFVEPGIDPVEANLIYRGENNGFEYALTVVDQARSAKFGTNNTIGGGSTTTHGWIFLSGNLVLNYGNTGNAASAAVNPKNFAKPYSSTPYFVMATSGTPTAISTTGFTLSNANVNWIAIGTIA